MKITFVLPVAGLAGGIRVIAIYAERLMRRGHKVVLISTPPQTTVRHALKTLLMGRGWPKPEPSYFRGMDVEHRILDRVRPVTDKDVPDADAVLATYYTTAEGVLHLSPSKGAKAIFIQNYEVPLGEHNTRLDETWRMPLHKITISEWLVRLARERFQDELVSHVPNSVDSDQFHAQPRGKQLVPTLGLLYNTFSLKGLKTSLPALKRVSKLLPSLRLISFGAEHPDFRLPLPPYSEFHFRPQQDALKQLYSRCDLWLCGSNREGFHLPPLEAMACRCPVVSTKVGGPLDIIREGINGHLVDVGDVDALADRALRVLKLPEERWRKMSDEAHRTAVSFSWDDATDRFEKALEFAIERDRRGDWKQNKSVAA